MSSPYYLKLFCYQICGLLCTEYEDYTNSPNDLSLNRHYITLQVYISNVLFNLNRSVFRDHNVPHNLIFH
jgi:hypothetical protein